MDTDGTYKIESYKVEDLTAAVAKINRKAEKLGCKPVGFWKVSAPYTEEGLEAINQESVEAIGYVEGINARRVIRTFVNVSVFGEVPKLAGWEFCGVLEPLGEGNLLKTVGNVELPESYRTVEAKCDHCHTIRRRLKTYIVRNESTGEIRQVGSTCIEDFLGGLSIEEVAQALECIFRIRALCGSAEEDEGMGCGKQSWAVNVQDFMALAVQTVRTVGYTSSRNADGGMATGRVVLNSYFDEAYEIHFEPLDAVAQA